MRVRTFFNSKQLERDMVSRGWTAADLHRRAAKSGKYEGGKLYYDSVQRVIRGESHKAAVVKVIADTIGLRPLSEYITTKKPTLRPDGRGGARRKARQA